MKNIGLMLFALIVLVVGCKDKQFQKYTANVPVYTDFETFRTSIGTVKYEEAKTIEQKGGIYFKDNFLFILDNFKGIYIIDNSNPSAPINKGYYAITGITGISINNQYLYVNAYTDLVVIDVSSIDNPSEVGRIENVFDYAMPTHDPQYPIAEIDHSKGIITGWTIEEYVTDKEPINGCFNCNSWDGSFENSIDFNINTSEVISSQGQGISGSITKFSLLNDFLYVMDGNNLKPFDLSNPTRPSNSNEVSIWREVETLFAYNNHIFMGTTTGMLIYDTDNRNAPSQIGVIQHANACDPVVVDGDYAYVTLRTGTVCSGQQNQLDVIDVSNYTQPTLKKTFSLKNPHGLGIKNNTLFVCDGTSGLKIFDATDPLNVGNQKIKTYGSVQATDIILLDNIAMLIGDDGLYQYDISDVEEIKEISQIKFK
ncbi:MAG: LVIVD repeat-containing protein [Crocinitomicaceae bacterium]